MTDCLFCKIAQKEIRSDLVYEDPDCVAFRDINPQAPTHLLVIPRRHIAKFAESGAENEPLLGRLMGVARDLATKAKLSDYRLVINNGAAAGQSVWHLHLHLLSGRPFSWPPG